MVTQIMRADGSSGTHRTDGLACTIARMMDKKADLERQLDEMMTRQEEIEEVIQQVRSENQRNVLRKRYILCHSFERIAEDMGMSERYVYELHGFGLLAVSAVLGQKGEQKK